MRFIELTLNSGRRIMVSVNQIAAFAECLDVKDINCRIFICGHDECMYVKETYEKVGCLIHAALS